MITQKMLQHYRNLYRREEELMAARKALRDRIVAMIKSGAVIEPGGVSCCVRVNLNRRLTRTTATKAFGHEFYEQIAAGVEPDEQISLHVYDPADRPRRRSGQRVPKGFQP